MRAAQTTATSQRSAAILTARTGIMNRQCNCGAHTIAGGECAECGKKREAVQQFAGNSDEPAHQSPRGHAALSSSGYWIDQVTRGFMESRFGHDFSRVRVHTDASAADSASTMNAMAYTVRENRGDQAADLDSQSKGAHIYFANHAYAPATVQGRAILAHELAHVVQNEKAGANASTANLETEAKQASVNAITGRPARIEHGSQQPVLAMTRAEHTAMWSGIGLGAGAATGALVGLGVAAATGGSAGDFAGIGALIGGGVGLVGGFFYGLFKRRTTAVGANEADVLIRRRFGAYLGGGTAGPLHGALVRPVPQSELCMWNRCRHPEHQTCPRTFVGWTDTGPEPPATIDSAEGEPLCANGQRLAHATPGRPVIYYATDVPDASVLVHEGVHAYASPAFSSRLRNYVNEGTTEYFTRQILDGINMPLVTGYEDELADVEKLVAITGEEVLRRAFFLGEMAQLDAAVARRLGPCALDEWALSLQMGSPARAEEVLQGRGQNYCPSGGSSSVLPSDRSSGNQLAASSASGSGREAPPQAG